MDHAAAIRRSRRDDPGALRDDGVRRRLHGSAVKRVDRSSVAKHPRGLDHVEQRYCRGDWGAPKSEASNATIPVNRAVIERIHRLKSVTVEVRAGQGVTAVSGREVRRSGRFGLSVASEGCADAGQQHPRPAHQTGGKGVGHRLGELAGFAAVVCDVAQDGGADVKDAQALMRHSRASTTLDIYQQFVPESQRRVSWIG